MSEDEDAVSDGVLADAVSDGAPADAVPDGAQRNDEQASAEPAVASAHGKRVNRRRAGALIGVLLALLGFGIAVQVHTNSSSDSLSSARQDDLIRILDDQDSREDRLRQQIAALQNTEQQLAASGDRDSVALQQAQEQLQSLGILLGTVAATGPGVTITITDPRRGLKAEDLLDVVEELRGAGAEAIQFGPVRVSTSTAFLDSPSGGVEVDGKAVQAPYTVLAIGDPQTLDTAMQIPGGVAATARAAGGDAVVRQSSVIEISALRTLTAPHYAKTSGR